MRVGREDQRAAVGRERADRDRQRRRSGAANCSGHDLVPRTERLEAVAGPDGLAELDRRPRPGPRAAPGRAAGRRRRGPRAARTPRRATGCGAPRSVVGDLEELALGPSARCPSRAGRCGGDDERPVGRDEASAGSMSRQARSCVPRDVAGRGLDQPCGRACRASSRSRRRRRPRRRAEGRAAALHRLVEGQAAGGLVLRGVVEDARLVDHARQVLGCRGGKP